MNIDDDATGQPIVCRPALSDAARSQTDKASPPMDQTLGDRDIFALPPPSNRSGRGYEASTLNCRFGRWSRRAPSRCVSA